MPKRSWRLSPDWLDGKQNCWERRYPQQAQPLWIRGNWRCKEGHQGPMPQDSLMHGHPCLHCPWQHRATRKCYLQGACWARRGRYPMTRTPSRTYPHHSQQLLSWSATSPQGPHSRGHGHPLWCAHHRLLALLVLYKDVIWLQQHQSGLMVFRTTARCQIFSFWTLWYASSLLPLYRNTCSWGTLAQVLPTSIVVQSYNDCFTARLMYYVGLTKNLGLFT